MRKFASHVEVEDGGNSSRNDKKGNRETIAEAMSRSGVVIAAHKMAIIDQVVAHENVDMGKQIKPAEVPNLNLAWTQENKKVSGTQVDASMLDEGKSPLRKFELASARKDTERSRVSRTIVGGNLELSNRASLE